MANASDQSGSATGAETSPQETRGRVSPAARDRRQAQPQIRPAHPLPEVRSGKLDYDRYLERSTDRFKIFSAEERRRRNRAIATGVAVLAVVVILVVWAVASQMA